jgi:hypothetical protein
MAVRVYIAPYISQTHPRGIQCRAPKYFFTSGWVWDCQDYGDEGSCVVVMDTTGAQHTSLTANADVLALPADLDANLTTGQANAAKTFLESRNIPNGFINNTLTSRQVLRVILHIFRFAQAVHVLGGKLFPTGITLDSTVGDLTAEQRQRLKDAADTRGWDSSGITLGTTMRALLKSLADQFPNTAGGFGGVSF